MISGTRYQLRLEVERQRLLASEIARAQSEISTGKKILAPSDEPAAAARISDIARSQANQTTWRSNLDKAAATSAQAETVVKSLATAFTRAAELMVQGANQTLSTADRNAIALELDSLSAHVVALRNTRDSRGELLFPDGDAIRIPVAADLELTAVETAEAVFDTVPSVFGIRQLHRILSDAATATRGGAPAAVSALLEEVNAGVLHLASVQAQHGAQANRIDQMIEQHEELAIVLQDERTGLESADITEVIAMLQAKELSLEAAQAAFARIHRSSLFDLIG